MNAHTDIITDMAAVNANQPSLTELLIAYEEAITASKRARCDDMCTPYHSDRSLDLQKLSNAVIMRGMDVKNHPHYPRYVHQVNANRVEVRGPYEADIEAAEVAMKAAIEALAKLPFLKSEHNPAYCNIVDGVAAMRKHLAFNVARKDDRHVAGLSSFEQDLERASAKPLLRVG